MNNNCDFCDISKKEILFNNNLCVIKKNLFPVNLGHLLIIPKRHFDNYFEITRNELLECQNLILLSKQYIDKKYNPDGYNIGVNIGEYGGQSIFHLHIHLIPRYKGDVETPRGGVVRFKKALDNLSETYYLK